MIGMARSSGLSEMVPKIHNSKGRAANRTTDPLGARAQLDTPQSHLNIVEHKYQDAEKQVKKNKAIFKNNTIFRESQ